MTVEVVLVTTMEEMRDALSIRRRVFIEEQSVDEAIEIDEHDADPSSVTTALHVLARVDGAPVATGRLLLERDHEGFAHVGRVAVLADRRGQGLGAAVMHRLHELAHEHGYSGIVLAAQVQAIPFYEALGYSIYGDVFQDANIDHRWAAYRFE